MNVLVGSHGCLVQKEPPIQVLMHFLLMLVRHGRTLSELPHLFSSITCLFKLGIGFLTHLSQSHHKVLTNTYQLIWGCDWVTSFLYSFAVYGGIYSWFEFFRVYLSTYLASCALQIASKFVDYYLSVFSDPRCGITPQAYIPWWLFKMVL